MTRTVVWCGTIAPTQLNTLHEGEVIMLQKSKAAEECLQPDASGSDLFGDLGLRDARVIELVAQGDQPVDGLRDQRLHSQPATACWATVRVKQFGHDQQLALRMIAFQHITQDTLSLAERRVAQVVAQLQAPATQGQELHC